MNHSIDILSRHLLSKMYNVTFVFVESEQCYLPAYNLQFNLIKNIIK